VTILVAIKERDEEFIFSIRFGEQDIIDGPIIVLNISVIFCIQVTAVGTHFLRLKKNVKGSFNNTRHVKPVVHRAI
jgi:hypothetical protein